MNFIKSKHNIFHKLHDSENYYIVNPLRGEADFLDPETAEEYKSDAFSDPEEWLEKGYILPEGGEKAEKDLYRDYYLKFLEERDQSEIQIFWVPTYGCNFACSYCYQDQYAPSPAGNTMEVQKAFFDYVKKEFAGRQKYITVFGGEPLLPGEGQKKLVIDLIERANEAGLSLAFVTNGYSLTEYIPILKKGSIREIQVTLDGIGETHDQRRPLKTGGGSYKTIVEGIDQAIKAGLTINLRAVLDRDNVNDLPKLAALARKRGWLETGLLKTQLGRNYELHSCQTDRNRLYDRVSMYKDIHDLIKDDSSILDFHKPAFSLSRFLAEQGKLPDPLFDSCPGCKTEWAFDYTGNIYSCTATVGKSGEELGTFFPVVTKKQEIIEEWEERDVSTIPECAGCSLQLACGGGCASVAKNKNGRVQSPDCRPVDKLMAMGLPLYLNEE
ncbi:MAG: radical SAM protein [Spirochaetales bacterium]|nr:radical SAM protein [Spirochaetales bacterium]